MLMSIRRLDPYFIRIIYICICFDHIHIFYMNDVISHFHPNHRIEIKDLQREALSHCSQPPPLFAV